MKAVMGLLEIAAAMKFLSNVDLVWGWRIFSREVVLVTWIVIASCWSCIWRASFASADRRASDGREAGE